MINVDEMFRDTVIIHILHTNYISIRIYTRWGEAVIYSRRGRNQSADDFCYQLALIIMYRHDSNLQQSFLQCDNNTFYISKARRA